MPNSHGYIVSFEFEATIVKRLPTFTFTYVFNLYIHVDGDSLCFIVYDNISVLDIILYIILILTKCNKLPWFYHFNRLTPTCITLVLTLALHPLWTRKEIILWKTSSIVKLPLTLKINNLTLCTFGLFDFDSSSVCT